MKKVILYIASSLDGYIADTDKSVDWIQGHDDSIELPDTYTPFFDSIDTIIMGKKTYDQIVNELSPDKWPYTGALTYVFTHEPLSEKEDIIFTQEKPCRLVNRIKKEGGKDIWVCGGADIINQLLEDDIIDVFHITTIPVILGDGIRLFGKAYNKTIKLKLAGIHNYNGIIEALYERRS